MKKKKVKAAVLPKKPELHPLQRAIGIIIPPVEFEGWFLGLQLLRLNNEQREEFIWRIRY